MLNKKDENPSLKYKIALTKSKKIISPLLVNFSYPQLAIR
jgi:hypothetical protein